MSLCSPLDPLVIEMRRDQPAFGQEVVERFRGKNRVRIAGVAQRIGEEAAEPQLVVRRPA